MTCRIASNATLDMWYDTSTAKDPTLGIERQVVGTYKIVLNNRVIRRAAIRYTIRYRSLEGVVIVTVSVTGEF